MLKHTKQVEVLDELPLGAGLVLGAKERNEDTLSEKAASDTIGVDIIATQAAGLVATRGLVGDLVDLGGLGDGSNAKGEGDKSSDGGELHCEYGSLEARDLRMEKTEPDKYRYI